MNVSSQLSSSDVSSILNVLGVNIKGVGWKTISSPLRDDDKNPSFSLNLETGAWRDHATGMTGDLVNLVSATKKITLKEACKWIMKQSNLSSDLYNLSTIEQEPVIKKISNQFWTDDRLDIINAGVQRLKSQPNHQLLVIAKEYDSIQPDTFEYFGCGIVDKYYKDQKIITWLAFPYATGCQLYKRNGSKIIRFLKGSKPNKSFFGTEQIKGLKTLFITKSPRETMLLFQEYSSHADVIGLASGEQGGISKEQIAVLKSQILISNYSEVYTFLDCDNLKAYQTAKQFALAIKDVAVKAKFKGTIKLVNIHVATGGTYKDVSDCFRDGMDSKTFQTLLNDAESITNIKSIENITVSNDTITDATSTLIPSEVFDYLPDILKSSCNHIEQCNRRNIFLISALPVLAAHMPNVIASHADGHYSPDLFTLIVADPGSGKGTAGKAKKLGSVLNKWLIEQSHQQIADYNEPSFESKTKRIKPKERSLFIPANSSSRAIYDTLEANGGSGLLFETEIDTLLNATGQDWGNFSDITRKAFHHESVSINRKSEQFFIEEPRLSIFISGTFDQFKKMFNSAENGHFSRYALFTFEVPRKWQSHRPTKQSRLLDKSIQECSDSLFGMYQLLNNREKPLYIDLEEEQWQVIDNIFAKKMQTIEDLGLSKYLHASNTRAAVLALRMASIFAVLRTFENNPKRLNSESITPTESDMFAALLLASTFFENAVRLYQILPKAETQDNKGDRYLQFIAKLPDEFTTSQAINIADAMQIPESTVKRWLAVENQFNRIKHGYYSKVSK